MRLVTATAKVFGIIPTSDLFKQTKTMDYNFKEIEKKWQKYWEENKTFKTPEDLTNPKKCYVLDMFPYPSGAGLHVGHPEGYTATDIYQQVQKNEGV